MKFPSSTFVVSWLDCRLYDAPETEVVTMYVMVIAGGVEDCARTRKWCNDEEEEDEEDDMTFELSAVTTTPPMLLAGMMTRVVLMAAAAAYSIVRR